MLMLHIKTYHGIINGFNNVRYFEAGETVRFGESEAVLEYKFDWQGEHFLTYTTMPRKFNREDIEKMIAKKTSPLTNVLIVVVAERQVKDLILCFKRLEGEPTDLYLDWVYYILDKKDFKKLPIQKFKYGSPFHNRG